MLGFESVYKALQVKELIQCGKLEEALKVSKTMNKEEKAYTIEFCKMECKIHLDSYNAFFTLQNSLLNKG